MREGRSRGREARHTLEAREGEIALLTKEGEREGGREIAREGERE